MVVLFRRTLGKLALLSGLGKQWKDAQPLVYRAPEVIYGCHGMKRLIFGTLGSLYV